MKDTDKYRPKVFMSSGGLGDAFIVGLKVIEYTKKNPYALVSWIHIESNNIEKPLFEAWNSINPISRIALFFQHEPNYTQTIKSRISETQPIIPTPIRGKCNFYQKEWPLENPFLDMEPQEKEYDIVLQCSAGTNNDRDWAQNPLQIAQVIASTGRHVTLIGNDERFKKPTKDPDKIMNLVKRTTLSDALDIILKCEIFIGHSGLLTFFSMAAKIPTIHCQYTEEANKNYIHEKWAPYFYNIEIGTLPLIMKELRKL